MKATKAATVSQPELDEFCQVCERVRWGNYQYLTHGHWRHEECAPGSKNWVENYPRRSKKTSEGDLLFKHHSKAL